MAAPRWRGHQDLEPGKVHYEDTAGKTTITLEYHGPYTVCLARKPAIGASITGLDVALKVTQSKVTELDGGAGRIDVTLEASADENNYSSTPLGEPSYEIEWVRLEKQIEAHPRCGKLYEGRAKYKDGVVNDTEGKQRTWDDWESLTYDAPEGYSSGDYLEESDASPTWTLSEYKSLKEKGQDSYVVYSPVIRRTSYHLSRPADVGAYSGKRTTPPVAAGFSRTSEFEWLGGPDRCTKQRRTYTRSTEWQGAKTWSDLTYET